MSKHWYEHWLKKGADAERNQNYYVAVVCLDRAKKHTCDPEELRHLFIWRSRLWAAADAAATKKRRPR